VIAFTLTTEQARQEEETMLEYSPGPGAVAHFRSPDGGEVGSGPFDAGADWTAVDSGNEDLFNVTFSKRYGGVPFDRARHFHPLIASEYLVVVASGLVPFALAHGWTPSAGSFSGSGDLSPRSLYDFAYTAPEIFSGNQWVDEWKAKRAAEPGWQTPRPPKETGRPTQGTWPWYLDRILNGHGERFTEWNSPAAAGHQQEIFDLCLAKLRAQRSAGVKIDEVTLESTHYWTPQPSLLLAALDDSAQPAPQPQASAGQKPVLTRQQGKAAWDLTGGGDLSAADLVDLARQLLVASAG
jgi:hypothetical protein